jgi:hypothetical protein
VKAFTDHFLVPKHGDFSLRRPLVWLQVVIFFVYTGVELTAG